MPKTVPPVSAATEAAPAKKRRKETRAADGDGGLYFDAKAGLWRGELMVGWKPSAKDPKVMVRDRRKVAARRQSDARAKLQQLRQERETSTLPQDSKGDSVEVYLRRWLASKQGALRIRTHDRYRQLVECHMIPALGKTKLRGLKPDQLQRLYASRLEEGSSPRTVHHIHSVLHNALEQAVKWGYVPRNVADVVEPPAVPAAEIRPLSGEDVGRLLDVAEREDDRLRALYAVAAHTGMRLGELLALRWADVDLEAGAVHVRRVLVSVKDRTGSYGEPKTKRSRREVPLTDDAIEALRAHKDRQAFERKALGDDYADEDLVFCTQLGTPLQRKVVQEAFKRALFRARLPMATRFHDLRHTAATLMLGNGVDIPTAAAVLGHSQNSTTLNVYAHAMPSRIKGATAAIQRAIRGA